MKKLLTLLLISISFFAKAQDPTGLPSKDTRKWVEFTKYVSVDSLFFFGLHDTTITPVRKGAVVFWEHANVDSTLWLWDAIRWKKLGQGGGLNDSTFYNHVTQLNDSTFTINRLNGTKDTIQIIAANGGTVDSLIVGNLSPLFTTTVTNPTSIPAIAFALSTAAAHKFFGNNTGSTATPAFYQPATGDLSDFPTQTGNSGKALTTNATTLSWGTFLTANQAITVTATGDATGTSTSSATAPSLPLVLGTVNSNVGTFTNSTVTVNAKGLVTAASSGSAVPAQFNPIQGVSMLISGTYPNITFNAIPTLDEVLSYGNQSFGRSALTQGFINTGFQNYHTTVPPTGAYTTIDNDYHVYSDGNVTLQIPTTGTSSSTRQMVIQNSKTSGSINVIPPPTYTLEDVSGASYTNGSPYTLTNPNDAIVIKSVAGHWNIIGRNSIPSSVTGITKAQLPFIINHSDSVSRRWNVLDYGADKTGVTDATAAFNAALVACDAGGGGDVFVPNGIYKIAGALVTNSQIQIPVRAYASASRTHIRIIGETRANFSQIGAVALSSGLPSTAGAILQSTLTTGATGAAVIGTSDATSNYNYLSVENIMIKVKNNPAGAGPVVGGISYKTGSSLFTNYVVVTLDTTGPASVVPTNDIAGIETPDVDYETMSNIQNTLVSGFKNGFKVGEHTFLNQAQGFICYNAFNFKAGYHAVLGGRLGSYWCTNGIQFSGSNTVTITQFDEEYRNTASFWYNSRYTINDSLNLGYGTVYHTTVQATSGKINSLFSKNGATNLNEYTNDQALATLNANTFVADQTINNGGNWTLLNINGAQGGYIRYQKAGTGKWYVGQDVQNTSNPDYEVVDVLNSKVKLRFNIDGVSTIGANALTGTGLKIAANGDVSFGSTPGAFWDGVNSRFGIGLGASPANLLDMQADFSGANGVTAQIKNTSSSGDARFTAVNSGGGQVIMSAGGSGYFFADQGTFFTQGTIKNLAFVTDGDVSTGGPGIIKFAVGGYAATAAMTIAATSNVLIGTTSDAASAILNVTSTTKGFLEPRMTTTQRDAISSPAEGLQVYNTTTHLMDFHNGTSWGELVSSASPTFTGTVTIPTPFTLGATSVTSTGTQLNYLNAATGTTGTTSTNLVYSTSPTLVTPVLGVATATSINKITLTAPATGSTISIADGKTVTQNNSITYSGTDATTMTFPTTTATIARTDAAQTFTGTQTFSGNSTVFNNNSATVRTTNGGSNVTAVTMIGLNGSANTAGNLAITTDNTTGQLGFAAANGTRQILRAGIGITNLTNTAGSETADLAFYTQTAGAAAAERMRIFAAGDISIGSTTDNAKLYVNGSTRLDLGSDATGDLYYRASGGNVTRLGIGTAGQVITATGGLPVWGAGSTSAFVAGSDYTTTSASAADVTGLSIAAVANKTYYITATLHIGCNNTGGVAVTIAGPSGAAIKSVSVVGTSTNSTPTILQLPTMGTLSTLAFNKVSATTGSLNITGYITTSATPGNITIQAAAGVAAQTATVYIGSGFHLTEMQ